MNLRQYGATIVKPIVPDRLDDLKTLLQSIGANILKNPTVPFPDLTSAHFMSWFIVEGDGFGPFLYLEVNVDGPIEQFLVDLVTKARAGIDSIYGHCSDYPPAGWKSSADAVGYLLRDNIGYDCYYIGWRGLTVERIHKERDLRARLEDFLDKMDDSKLAAMQPSAIRTVIQKYVASDPTLDWAKTFPPRPFLVRNRNQILMCLRIVGIVAVLTILGLGVLSWLRYGPWPDVVVAAVLLGTLGGLVALLVIHEETDSVSTDDPDNEQVTSVASQENFFVQNHFASVALVKPGLFRWLLLKLVLKLVHWVAAIAENQGSLSGITSIHFARWVVIDGGKRLLFLSNYDGSWENYLDDFIDLASRGLTAIWSNTTGFPRSHLLVYGGATDALLFKTLVRKSQKVSLVWYNAYPDLSIQNIRTNAAIREGLFAPMDDAAERAWLKNF